MWYKTKSFKIFVMKIWDDYRKVLDVIDSCLTIEQLKAALKMLGFWHAKYGDDQVYENTYRNQIKIKYSKLGGFDASELPFKIIKL